MSVSFAHVIEEIDLLLLEFRQLKSAGPHFRIFHRFRVPGTECAPGEEVAAVFLVHRGCEFCLPLSLTLRLVFDFLAKHARLPQSASQIADCFRDDPFYRKRGANVARHGELRRRIARSAIRVYVQRIREALALSFREANLHLDSRNVLASAETVMNETGYRLRGTFQWFHTDHPGDKLRWIR
jgi:hypothetical protein